MKRLLTTLILSAVALAGYSQESTTSPIIEQELSPIESLEINGNIKLTIVQDSSLSNPKVSYNLNGGGEEYFTLEVRKDSELFISERTQKGRTTTTEVTLHLPTLKSIKSTMADIWIKGVIKAPLMDVTLNSRSKLSGEINLLDLQINLSGKSAAQLSGDARYLTITTSGSNVAAGSLSAMSVRVDASQRANVEVMASDRIEASVATNAEIHYRGDPSIIRTYNSFVGGIISHLE